MGFISGLLEKRFTVSELDKFMDISAGFYGPTHSSVNVTEEQALKSSAVYACVRLLSWSIASLPLQVYQHVDRGKEKARSHPVYSLLHDQPNPEMTSFTYRSTCMSHIALWGNSYSEIVFRNGSPRALYPIPPWRVAVKQRKNKSLYYGVTLPNGKKKDIPDYRMLHIMGLSTDGYKGMSVIGAAREAIGLSLAAEEFGARFFGQGTHMGTIARHPGKLTEQGHKNLSKSLTETYSGLGKSHRLLLLEEGMEIEKIGIPPEDAQFLQTREFQIAEIARIYNVPLHLIQETSKATSWGSGIEQLNIGFVTHSLRPYLVNWEQEVKRKLFSEDKDHFAEFNVDGLLRGDAKQRADFYSRMFQMAAMSPNDIRAKENENPYEGGDEYYIQLNMVPVSMALTVQEKESMERAASPEERAEHFRRIKHNRSAQTRFRISKSYEKVIAQTSARIIRREEADIMRKARKIFTPTRDNGPSELLLFSEFLNEFYEGHQEYMRKQMLPVLSALAEAISKEAALEVDLDDDIKAELERFVAAYEEKYGLRHSIESNNILYSKVKKAIEEGEDPLDELQEQFDHWEETRPQQEATHESVKLGNAIARTVFVAAGVKHLRWVAMGDDPCPWCDELDDRVIGIQGNFFNKGDDFKVGGESLPINTNTSHPPIHRSCVCAISAD